MAAARPAQLPELPGYTLRHEIGASSRATVWLASPRRLGRNVALKVTKQLRDDGDARGNQIFAREYEAVAAISHPAIVDLYDYGVHEGREYLAMEYFPCGDLKARLQHPICAGARRSTSYGASPRALRVVHEAGIVHRDLKPPNVMLRESGDVVLIDFGLARGMDESRAARRRDAARIALLHESGAGPGPVPGRADRPLQPRRDVLRDAHGQEAVTGSTAIEVLQQHVAAAAAAARRSRRVRSAARATDGDRALGPLSRRGHAARCPRAGRRERGQRHRRRRQSCGGRGNPLALLAEAPILELQRALFAAREERDLCQALVLADGATLRHFRREVAGASRAHSRTAAPARARGRGLPPQAAAARRRARATRGSSGGPAQWTRSNRRWRRRARACRP